MKNCIITKLNGTVDNSSLEKFGYLYVHVKAVNTNTYQQRDIAVNGLNVSLENPVIIETVDGSAKLSRNTDLSSPSNKIEISVSPGPASVAHVYVLDGEYDVCIKNKYELTLYNPSGAENRCVIGDISIFKYCTYLKFLNFNFNTNIKGSIDELSGLENVESLNVTKTSVSGNIVSLAGMTKLTYLNLSRSSVGGAIESLLNSMASSRTSGELTIYYHNSNITYNGSTTTSTSGINVKFGTSMVNPSKQEIAQGWQVG